MVQRIRRMTFVMDFHKRDHLYPDDPIQNLLHLPQGTSDMQKRLGAFFVCIFPHGDARQAIA